MTKAETKQNIYEKLQNMRVELQQKGIKKSGKNKYAGYNYYELGDILPPINELQKKYKTCSVISFESEKAILTIINSENTDEKIIFESPMAELILKGGQAIQNLGGVETYQRRYLYMTAYEIVENDYFDAVQGKAKNKKEEKTVKSDTVELKENYKSTINSLIVSCAKKYDLPTSEVTKKASEYIGKPLDKINNELAVSVIQYLDNEISKPVISDIK